MKKIRKALTIFLLPALMATAFALSTASCHRMYMYEDGMFDDNEIYNDDPNDDTYQINSEVDNDDQERY